MKVDLTLVFMTVLFGTAFGGRDLQDSKIDFFGGHEELDHPYGQHPNAILISQRDKKKRIKDTSDNNIKYFTSYFSEEPIVHIYEQYLTESLLSKMNDENDKEKYSGKNLYENFTTLIESAKKRGFFNVIKKWDGEKIADSFKNSCFRICLMKQKNKKITGLDEYKGSDASSEAAAKIFKEKIYNEIRDSDQPFNAHRLTIYLKE